MVEENTNKITVIDLELNQANQLTGAFQPNLFN